MSDTAWRLKKLAKSARMCVTLFLAQMRGHYVHSVGGYDFDYAVYEYRGKTYAIPTSAMEARQ